MILADENIDHSIIQMLRKNGFSVTSIFENHRGISDEEVISLSKTLQKLFLLKTKILESGFSHIIKKISA